MRVTFLTLAAEIGGVALALELATSVNYLLGPGRRRAGVGGAVAGAVRGAGERLRAGRAGADRLRGRGLEARPGLGRAARARRRTRRCPAARTSPTYWYYAIALFGAAMTPYEVFFFSSGGVEEKWAAEDLRTMRANVFIGFPLGGLLSLAIAAAAAIVLLPRGIEVTTLGQVGPARARAARQARPGRSCWSASSPPRSAPPARPACRWATASPSTSAGSGASSSSRCAQPGSTPSCCCRLRRRRSAILLTTVDPIMVTEYSVVFSAVALPLTYLPILVVANDRTYMGDHVNGQAGQRLGTVYLVILAVASVAAIPLMIITKAGQ